MPPLHKGEEQRAKVAPLFPGKSSGGSSSSAAPARAIVIQNTSAHMANSPEEEEEGENRRGRGDCRPKNSFYFWIKVFCWLQQSETQETSSAFRPGKNNND